MSLFDKLINKINDNSFTSNKFDEEEYDKFNNERIEEFKSKYDLYSIAGIRSIPKEEARRYSDGGKSVVYMPEQILNRMATEHKKNNKFDLAIECLRKANEMYPLSFYAYSRNEYERLVDFLVLAGKFDEAKKEHKKLDKIYGSRLDELNRLKECSIDYEVETKEDYQRRIIDPYINESRDREQYYWLLENIPQIAPKSFGAYRKIKNLKSASYNKIVNEIDKKGYKIENLTFWL